MSDQRYSDDDVAKRDIPSFIEALPPLIQNPFMRRRPPKGMNLLELFEEDEEPEWVQVYLRLKPCKIPNNLYEIRSDRCLVTSLDTATAGHGRRTQHNVSKMYTFSKIFGAECNQKEIFESVVKENLRKLPDGQNFTLLTYGASGSGKTFTLMGTVGAPGLVPRSLEYVFGLVDAAQHPAFKPAENGAETLSHVRQDYELQWVKRLRHVSGAYRDKYRRMSAQLQSDLTVSTVDLTQRIRYYVWVSFVEIYNDAIYDLLVPIEKRTKLRIREDASGNVYVKGAQQAFVRSAEEAYDVMVAGKHNLMVAATGVHAHSSRSHCIFTITMLTETGSGSVRTAAVRLCDLAGCERARATHNTGARMAESRAINSSLHVLERCLHMLRSKQRSGADTMVPYRESKLTRLLGTALSRAKGESISIVVTLNPSPQYAHETKHVLGLAVVARDIQVNNTIFATTMESSTQETTINNSNEEVMMLRADVERLNFELVQMQARNKELMASIDEKQQETGNTMRELVEEAKDFTKKYYEFQLEVLRSRMEDMQEEYESRLANVPAPSNAASSSPSTDASSSPHHLLKKITQLVMDNAELEEKLTAEHLARVQAEMEVKELRASIAKINEKVIEDSVPMHENVTLLSDSSEQESDEETDQLNDSLEPIFNNNRSISQNKCHYSLKSYVNTIYDNEITHDENDESTEDSTIDTDNEERVEEDETQFKNESVKRSDLRGTYFISDDKHNEKCDFSEDVKEKKINSIRGTYFVKDPLTDVIINSESDELEPITDVFKAPIVRDASKVDFKLAENMTSKIVREKSNDDMKTTEQISKILGSKIVREKSKIDMTIPQQLAENLSRNIIREISNIEMRAEKPPEPLVKKIIREKSNVNMKVSENITKNKISEKSDVEINVTADLWSKDYFARQESTVDISPKQVPENLSNNEKSDTDLRPKKMSEPLVSKIIKEKSDLNIKEPAKVSENITRKIIREKSDAEINVTKNQCSKLISEESIIDITSPKHVTENFSNDIIREKSDTDMRAKKVSEPLVSNIIREKSDLNMKVPEKVSENITRKIIRVKSDVVINVTENLVSKIIRDRPNTVMKPPEPLADQTREKFNVEMKAPEKVPEKIVSKIMRSFRSDQRSDISLMEFEQLEKASKKCNNDVRQNLSVFSNIKIQKQNKKTFDSTSDENYKPQKKKNPVEVPVILVTEKRTYFDNLGANIEVTNKRLNHVNKSGEERSPSIVKDVVADNFEPSRIKKLLGESLTKSDVQSSSTHKTKFTKKHDSVDIFDVFDSPVALKTKQKIDNVDVASQSIENVVLDQQSDKKTGLAPRTNTELRLYIREEMESEDDKVKFDIKKEMKFEPISSVEESDYLKTKLEPASSIDEPGKTMNETQAKGDNTMDEFEKIYKDITVPRATEFDLLVSEVNENTEQQEKENHKYNLRKKQCQTDYSKADKSKDGEILVENQAKSKSNVRKRALRLQRTKNLDITDYKLKDILNLQTEFSDVTLDVPAPQKEIKDIPSPEKGAEESLSPLLGIQSCPSKSVMSSVTRSRRKLFTPRAEPLEESPIHTGDTSNERVYVPRPSYHRPRARRKLN